jgi:hypothetical protein
VAASVAGDAGRGRSGACVGRRRCRKGPSWCLRRSPAMLDGAELVPVSLDVVMRCGRLTEVASWATADAWAGPNTNISIFSHYYVLLGCQA